MSWRLPQRAWLPGAGWHRCCFRREAGRRVRDPRANPKHRSSDTVMAKPSESRFGRQWCRCGSDVPEAGAARVVFTTRPAQGGTDDDCALWGNPRIEAPRPFSDFAAPLRSAVAAGSLRGMWHGRCRPIRASYRLWVRENEPSGKELGAQRELSAEKPRAFTLITYVAEPAGWSPQRTARACSSRAIHAGNGLSPSPKSRSTRRRGILLESRATDVFVSRRTVGQHAGGSMERCAARDGGEFAALLDSGDVLAPAALYEMAGALEARRCDVVYSDEDRNGPVRAPHPRFKPDWSPELLLASNYIGRLAMIRVAARHPQSAVSVSRSATPRSGICSCVCRARRARIRRVPRCLYHREETRSSDREQTPRQAVLRIIVSKLGLQAERDRDQRLGSA